MQSGKINNHAANVSLRERVRKRGQPVVDASLVISIVPRPQSYSTEVPERRSSPVIHAINTEHTFEGSTGSGHLLQITK
jgi:hypothetical protein